MYVCECMLYIDRSGAAWGRGGGHRHIHPSTNQLTNEQRVSQLFPCVRHRHRRH